MKYNQLQESRKQWNKGNQLFWDTVYKKNDNDGHRLRTREEEVLNYLDGLNLKKGSNILELGYGAGVTSAKIYERGFNIVGVDISKPLCKIAINNCKKIKNNKVTFDFRVGNVEKLDFEDNTFDCVIGIGFLQYLEFPNKCLDEVYRVLKPNCCFIIGQRNMYGFHNFFHPFRLMGIIVYLITNRRYELRLKGFFRGEKIRKNALSLNRLKVLIEGSKLKVINYCGVGYRVFGIIFDSCINNLDKFGDSVVIVSRKEDNK